MFDSLSLFPHISILPDFKRIMSYRDILYLKALGYWGVEWINVAQDRSKWRTFVNIVIKFTLCGRHGIS
jgi:hypothetical protein